MKSKILIDLNNVAFILHKGNNLNKRGLQDYISRLQSDLDAEQVEVILDSPASLYWRKSLYKDYKGNRKDRKKDPKLKKNLFTLCQELPSITCIDRLEADDVIASQVRSRKLGLYYVVSSDGDFKQLAFYNCFKQYNPLKRKILETTKRDAVKVLVTKILKGDGKDNIKKSHNQKAIKTLNLDLVVDKICEDILEKSQDISIFEVQDLGLEGIFWNNLSLAFDMDEDKFQLNFRLLDLIQNHVI